MGCSASALSTVLLPEPGAHVCTVNPHRAGTGVVVASLYYQSANKGKEGKGSHKEAPKPSAVVYRSTSGIKAATGTRTSFAGVGQAPRASVHQDEDAAESAALLEPKAGAEQR